MRRQNEDLSRSQLAGKYPFFSILNIYFISLKLIVKKYFFTLIKVQL